MPFHVAYDKFALMLLSTNYRKLQLLLIIPRSVLVISGTGNMHEQKYTGRHRNIVRRSLLLDVSEQKCLKPRDLST